MATSKEDMQTNNLTYRRYKEGDSEWSSMHDKIFLEDTSYKCPTYVHRTPPCQGSCPSGEDIRGWLDIVRGIETPPEGMTKEEYAFQRSTTANPFPAMMGRVCPAPCQDGCNRNDLDDFVGINSVEQYIGDSAFTGKYKFAGLPALGKKKVAIIGGGVAGMSAAYHLRKFGIGSTIFDDHSELGGMMRYGIPGYRTPRDVMDHECMRILDMGGIETKLNTRVGKDVPVADLEKDYDAVLWALGCKKGRGLFIEDWKDVPNCVTAVDFLEQFNKGEMKYTGKKIVCVGGGDTSIDVVSVSRRIGTLKDMGDEKPEDSAEGRVKHGDIADADKEPCTNVTLTALFKQEEMTAAEHEVNDALVEGVTIMNEVMPVEIIKDANGRATALKLVDSKFENNAPVAIEGGKEYTVECDLIVSAIGQFGDLEGVEDMDNGRSLIDADKFYQVPGKPGHFVAGDIVRPHLLTTAIGQGSVVAETIKQYVEQSDIKKRPKVDVHHFNIMDKLTESNMVPEAFAEKNLGTDDQRGTDSSNYAIHNYEDRSKKEIISTDEMFLGHFEAEARNLRTEDVPSSDEVLGHFAERMNGLTEETAAAEAGRCMSCGMCFECDNCVIFCPQNAVFRVKKDQSTIGRYVDTDYTKCIGCHICADVCPTGYIDMGMGE
ncbi:Protein similar to glutamate synthase [NADPH] small chain, clustered with sulfite reductase [hydrothermal vent metagenome]|uniref:Protein similar to glutamate synthase [NADPH] small chain, clustered with sulfite reductase n=1 Tax=hydrothermal vent metagenome TaxID=652676 RepID=A0A3B0X5E9_9ZZZZ